MLAWGRAPSLELTAELKAVAAAAAAVVHSVAQTHYEGNAMAPPRMPPASIVPVRAEAAHLARLACHDAVPR